MGSFFRKGLAAALFLALTAQSGYAATTKTTKEVTAPVAKGTPAEVVLRVDGKEFTRENIRTAVDNLLPMMSYHSSVSEERYNMIQKTAIDQLINRELVYKNATKDPKNLPKVTNKEIDEEISKIKKRLPKDQTLDKVLKKSNMTMADLRDDFKRKIIIDRVVAKKNEEFKKQADATVNEAYLKDYYQKNIDKFKEPEQIHLRSILIKADPAGGQKVWNEAKNKAQDVTNKAKAGESFEALAKKYSEDPNAKNGGDMGWAHKGSLFPEIDEAASKMAIGEVSAPIMTIYGYHILKLEGKKPSVQKKFEEINKKKLESELQAKEYKNLVTNWQNELRSTAKIEYLADDIKPKEDKKTK